MIPVPEVDMDLLGKDGESFPVRNYPSDNGPLVVVPVDYDDQLHYIALDREASVRGKSEGSASQSALSNRATPEDVLPLVGLLPAPEIVSRIILMDSDEYTRFADHVYQSEDGSSSGFVGTDIYLFRQKLDGSLVPHLVRQWARIAYRTCKVECSLFDKAWQIEGDEYDLPHTEPTIEGSWISGFTHCALTSDKDALKDYCRQASLRAACIAEALLSFVNNSAIPEAHPFKARAEQVAYLCQELTRARLQFAAARNTTMKDAATLILRLSPDFSELLAEFTGLDLSGQLIYDRDLNRIRAAKKLRNLDLAYTFFNDAAPLATLTELEELSLRGSRIDSSATRYISELRHLRELDLNQTEVNDAGALELGILNNLRKLDLRSTRCTTEAIATLRQHLPQCDILF